MTILDIVVKMRSPSLASLSHMTSRHQLANAPPQTGRAHGRVSEMKDGFQKIQSRRIRCLTIIASFFCQLQPMMPLCWRLSELLSPRKHSCSPHHSSYRFHTP